MYRLTKYYKNNYTCVYNVYYIQDINKYIGQYNKEEQVEKTNYFDTLEKCEDYIFDSVVHQIWVKT